MQSFDVYTLGFSNRSWEATTEILLAYGIERVIDIRTLPGSRHAPQFNRDHLERALPRAGIEYRHLKSLGGFRKLRGRDPANSGWRSDGFRAYADYMQTPEFEAALGELIQLFSEKRAAYACTEAVFWRCHRTLVSDALLVRGYRIGHVSSTMRCEAHRLTAFARADGRRITYPPPPEEGTQLDLEFRP